jgi:hypothetical protein
VDTGITGDHISEVVAVRSKNAQAGIVEHIPVEFVVFDFHHPVEFQQMSQAALVGGVKRVQVRSCFCLHFDLQERFSFENV